MRISTRARRRTLLGLASLGLVAGAFHATPASAATTTHYLRMNGVVDIEDYEEFGSNAHCNGIALSGRAVAANTAIVRDTNNKCDGEIRVEVTGEATLVGTQLCNFRITVDFFEGSTTDTSDRDGRAVLAPTGCLPANVTSNQFTIHVWNTAEDEPEDNADVRVSFRHETVTSTTP